MTISIHDLILSHHHHHLPTCLLCLSLIITPTVYYMRKGWSEGANKWMLYYEGKVSRQIIIHLYDARLRLTPTLLTLAPLLTPHHTILFQVEVGVPIHKNAMTGV